MNPLWKPAELAYRGVNRARRALYRNGILPSHPLPRPVISVGNVSMGGSGKTPAVILIAELLTAREVSVAVLTRGYGRPSGAPDGVLTSHDAAVWGDEPVLIASRLPGIPVIVGANRYINASRFLGSSNCDCFILDDGFQHLRLRRDLDVVIWTPPAGEPQREGAAALRHADVVLARGATPPFAGSRMFRTELRPIGVRIAGTMHPAESLRGRRVFAFSGLARNAQFFDTVTSLGATLAGVREFPDHHRYSPADVDALRRAAAASDAAPITTEKDWVKIGSSDMMALAVAMTVDGEDDLARILVDRIAQHPGV